MRSPQCRQSVYATACHSRRMTKTAGVALMETLENRQLLSVAGLTYNVFPAVGNGTNFLQNLTAGPDGNIYCSSGLANNITAISTAGAVLKVYDTTQVSPHGPSGLTVGTDGNIWFDEMWGDAAGYVDLATKTVVPLTITSTAKLNGPLQVCTGPDGNFWAESFDAGIERYTPQGVVMICPYSGSGSGPIVSFNGEIYFGQGTSIGSLATSGVFGPTYTPGAGGNVQSLTVGPNGNLWYTQAGSGNDTNNHYGYVTPAGVVHDFTIANSYGTIGDIAAPADGNLYFRAGDYIFGVNTAGTVVATQNIGESDSDLIAGPDGNLWFNESLNDQVGVVYIHATAITVNPPPNQTALVGTSQAFALGAFTQANGTAPFSVDVNWGDGSADSTIPVASAGAIPAADHAYTAVGSDTVTLTVTDSAGHISKAGTFTVTVNPTTPAFSDLTAWTSIAQGTAAVTFSGQIAAGTVVPPSGESVFITLDGVTQSAPIDAQGDFASTFNTSALPQSATPYQVTYFYAGDTSLKSVTNSTTTQLTVTTPISTASISGTVYIDANHSGIWTPGDAESADVMVYLDTNNNGKLDAGEISTNTDEFGDYHFSNLAAGNYTLRQVVPGGYVQTSPVPAVGAITVSVSMGQAVTGQTFLDASAGSATEQAVYRLYSPVTLEHLYTTDANEYNTLEQYVGTWNGEGEVFNEYSGPASVGGVADEPLYRLYDSVDKQHFWTDSYNEYNTLRQAPWNWNDEGTVGYVFPTAVANSAPLYRLMAPQVHLWTTDLNEYNILAGEGWTQEGASGYVL